MPTLKHFVEAMSVAWPVALAALIGAGGMIAGYELQVFYLYHLPVWLVATAAIIACFAAGICISGIIASLFKLLQRFLEGRRHKQDVKRKVALLNDLSQGEHHVLSYFLWKNQQAFTLSLNASEITPLVTKGLVIKVPGTHHVLSWPYTIPDPVWQEIKRRENEFRYNPAWGTPFRSII